MEIIEETHDLVKEGKTRLDVARILDIPYTTLLYILKSADRDVENENPPNRKVEGFGPEFNEVICKSWKTRSQK